MTYELFNRRQKDTALHWAAFKGHAEVVQVLLQAGAHSVSIRHELCSLVQALAYCQSCVILLISASQQLCQMHCVTAMEA